MVSARSKWTAIDNKTRKEVLERDGNKCLVCSSKDFLPLDRNEYLVCGSRNFLTLAHVFVNRSHGGRGCKENLVCLCVRHHEILDNYIGEKEKELSEKISAYCKNYLIKKECIDYNEKFLKNLIFSKSLNL